MKIKLKKIIGKLHLWFGLLIGGIVFLISISGALYVFKDEVESTYLNKYIYLDKENTIDKKVLPIKELENLVYKQVKEEYPLHFLVIPVDKNKSYKFYYYERNKEGWNYFKEFPIIKIVYVNPYNGEVIKVYNEKLSFFSLVKFFHWGFFLNSEWGKLATGIPVLIFIGMLLTGIYLWWPKNKVARKQRFWFKWKKVKSWKRKSYDLHNIIGFYTSIFGIIFSITGLFYSFFFIQVFIYFIFSGGQTSKPNFSNIKTKDPIELKTPGTLDIISEKVKEIYPNADSYLIDLGNEHMDEHEHPNFSVYVKHLSYSFHKSSNLIFDENSGKLLHQYDPKDKNFGEKMIDANYDIHVGAIGGLTTKILAFIFSLACASLPVTGFLIWYGRKKKKNKIKK